MKSAESEKKWVKFLKMIKTNGYINRSLSDEIENQWKKKIECLER